MAGGRRPRKPRAKKPRQIRRSITDHESVSSFDSDSDFVSDEREIEGTSRQPRKRKISTAEGRKRNQADIDSDFDFDSAFSFNSSDSDSFSGEDEIELAPRLIRKRKTTTSTTKGRKRKQAETKSPLLWETWADMADKWLDGAEKELADLDRPICNPTTLDPSPDILLPLLRFQKEWLSWALNQESSEIRGGILADEMGMGKTIQAISLVLTSRYIHTKSVTTGSTNSSDNNKCSLVICPVVAVIQWAGEIERHTEKGSARVLVYHGSKRSKGEIDFSNYDFVLTTYSTIESDYRKYIMKPKERCEYCRKMFYPNKMKIHLRYYCGPDAMKTEKQSKQVSKRNSKSWDRLWSKNSSENDSNIEKRKGNKNKNKNKNKKENKEEEMVDDFTISGKSPLHSVKWERIILDEAHFIKDRRCNTARAVFALESEYKWALSGTPLQNRVGELYSLIRFLHIFPYSYYFCKDCDCKVLDHGSSKTCTICSHSSMRHFCWWNRYIARPIQNGSNCGMGKRAMILLKEKVLKSVVLRRTKKGRAADIALPPRIVTLRRDTLDKKELEFYEALYTQSRTQFDSYVAAGTLMNNYAHIFDLLTRLRQAVDHPYLVIYSLTAELPEGCNKDDTSKSKCGICHQLTDDFVVTSCEHIFCKSCLIDYSSSLGNVTCPSCLKPLTVDLTTSTGEKRSTGEKVTAGFKGFKNSGILSRLNDISDFKTSTKIDALREEIRNMVENDGSAKGIVFSQFTSFLDLIHFSLRKSGIKCVQLVGSMTLQERDKAIKAFTSDPDCKIFLMSLKAGGVALNLTVASHVFLMDPWWNPAVEKQAQDRIHRIGQFKPIRSVRFVIEDTIEERILKLQEKKELVFEGTVGDSAEAMARLTEADLRFLFHT